MIFSLRARRSLTHDSARSGEPISRSIFMVSSLAPPWSGPLSVPRPVVTAAYISARGDVVIGVEHEDRVKDFGPPILGPLAAEAVQKIRRVGQIRLRQRGLVAVSNAP